MSLKLQFVSLSLGASVDQQTGNLSVFDVVEEFRTPQVPFNVQSLVIAIALSKTAAPAFTGKLLIHIFTPDGQQALVGTGEVSIPADQPRMRAVFRFGGFPVREFGEHRFVVSWTDARGTKIGEALLDFDVVQVTQVAQGAAPANEGKGRTLN